MVQEILGNFSWINERNDFVMKKMKSEVVELKLEKKWMERDIGHKKPFVTLVKNSCLPLLT